MSKEQFCIKEGVDKLLQYNLLSATGCNIIAPKNNFQRNLLSRGVSMMDPDIDLFHHPPGDCCYGMSMHMMALLAST
jgi:hypothetical protein